MATRFPGSHRRAHRTLAARARHTHTGVAPRRRWRGLLWAAALLPAWSAGAAQCDDVAGRGHLNLVSLNLLFSEVAQRDLRLAVVADGLAAMAQGGEPVDALLLQEVVGGPLAGTANSAQDLREMLAARGLDYDLAYFKVNGTPRVAEVGNAVLTRCEIAARADVVLPAAVERVLPDLNVPLRRAVSLVRLRLAGLGAVNLYNTHLCAYCDAGDRLRQAQAMMAAMESMEAAFSAEPTRAIVLGGDINTDLEVPADRPVYELITAGYGLRDAYAERHQCRSCCSAAAGYTGCTFGQPGNPFAVDIFTGETAQPQRIDYFFWYAPAAAIADAQVVSDSGYWVSDHSPLLVRLAFAR